MLRPGLRVSAFLALSLAFVTGAANAKSHAVVPDAAAVKSYDIGSGASDFLQSKTRETVLERDDKADAGACRQKRFVRAAAVGETKMRVVETVTERKWQEMWALARCGTDVYYLIYFTEVGTGGAYYAIVGPQTVAELQRYVTAKLPAPPASRDFVIYFDANKHGIRADAGRILDSVADAARQSGSQSIVLTGHTDTTGSPAYNEKLSEERVRAAKEYLARHGISAAKITTLAKGESDLRVKTADQVSEQKNRNVRIEIQ
jgi:outer membrane protein OmpA-like peptidoglycan-associated protein